MPNDDRFEDREAKIQRTAREAALRQFPNPSRIGCPDSETIIAIATKSLPFDHPAMVHVAQCSECLQDIARLEAAEAVKRRRRLWAGIAVLLIVVGMGTMVALHVLHWPTLTHNGGPKYSAARIAVLDLRPFAPYRGTTNPDTSHIHLTLPRATLSLSIYLSPGSKLGEYEIQLLDDRLRPVASARGQAQIVDNVPTLATRVNLTFVTKGKYTLALRPVGAEWQTCPVALVE
jgi:hypothetical protein